MARQAVDGNAFFCQNVHTNFQGGHGGVKLGAKEIRQGKAAVRTADHHGSSPVQMGHALPCQIIVSDDAAAVGISLQTLLIELGIERAGVNLPAEQLRRLPEDPCPGVHI